MGGEKTRPEWRRAVQQSLLPSGVKLMLTKHSEPSHQHHHDDATNVHGIKRERLAVLLGVHESTVRRQFRTAERTGWLQRHEDGHNGRQQTYHYVRPRSPWSCAECDERQRREASREAKPP